MILSTTNNVENFNIQKYLGVICAQEVVGVNILSNFVASISDIVGGTSGSYRSRLTEIYDSAVSQLTKQATVKGANAILGISINVGEVSGKSKQMFMITIIGTAVIVIPDRYLIFKKILELSKFREEGLLSNEEYEYEKNIIIQSHANHVQKEILNEKIRLETERQAAIFQEKRKKEQEEIKAKIEADKAKRLYLRDAIESLTEEDLINAEYSSDIDSDLNIYENCKILLNKGKCAEAALYYIEETGLNLSDAIEYIRDV